MNKNIGTAATGSSGPRLLRAAIASIVAATLTACVGIEADKTEKIKSSSGSTSGLKVTLADYRFGVQEVGSQTPQRFTLKNVGVDLYPINAVKVGGDQPQDFTLQAGAGITLEPGQQFDIDVAFVPLAEGRRTASLEIDYSIIRGVGSNAVEAYYYNAKELEDDGDILAAAQEYQRYLSAGATTHNKPRAMIKLSLLGEADVYGIGRDFNLYKEALNQRDNGDVDGAVLTLETLLQQYPDSYLVDDTRYMLAYINLIDKADYDAAYTGMQALIDYHPDSAYVDTAYYSQGLIEFERGNLVKAEAIFVDLKDRHTSVKLDLFEMRWPKDNYVSRLWYGRADEQIEAINQERSEG